MNTSTNSDGRKLEVSEGLKPLFERARKEGLWFQGNFQSIWFSPDELEAEQKEGRYIWGPTNWRLTDPKEHLHRLQLACDESQGKYKAFEDRLTPKTGGTALTSWQMQGREHFEVAAINVGLIDGADFTTRKIAVNNYLDKLRRFWEMAQSGDLLGKHKWVCEANPGMYDTVYNCSKCNGSHTVSIDNINSGLPDFGCTS